MYGRVLYSYPSDAESDELAVRSFVESYREKYQATPDAYGAEAYKAVRLAALAAAGCKHDLAYEVNSYVLSH